MGRLNFDRVEFVIEQILFSIKLSLFSIQLCIYSLSLTSIDLESLCYLKSRSYQWLCIRINEVCRASWLRNVTFSGVISGREGTCGKHLSEIPAGLLCNRPE